MRRLGKRVYTWGRPAAVAVGAAAAAVGAYANDFYTLRSASKTARVTRVLVLATNMFGQGVPFRK